MSRFEVKTQWEARGEIDSTVSDLENQSISLYDNKQKRLISLSPEEACTLSHVLWGAFYVSDTIREFPDTLRSCLRGEQPYGGVPEERVVRGKHYNSWTNEALSSMQQAIVDRMVDTGEITRNSKGYLNVAVS